MNKILAFSMVLVPLVFTTQSLTLETRHDDGTPSFHMLVEQPMFMGVDKCKTCHKKPEEGEQFRIWQESKHAKAYETLASDEAKAIAAKRGIENPQTAAECLECHVTAFGVDAQFLGEKYTITEGVGCETCHGAGGDYYKKKTMQGLTAGEIDPASVGLIQPNEELCLGCHNDRSPTFKAFNFEEASQSIAHPRPDSTQVQE